MVEHLVPLGLLAAAAALLCAAARRSPGRWLDWAAAVIALTIVLTELSWQPYVLANHTWSVAYSLPVQLCDIGGFIAAAALIWRRLLLVEIAYFWGFGGTLQALLTPDLKEHFPSFPYLQFYVSHDLVVLAALFLIVGLELHPRLLGADHRHGLARGPHRQDHGHDGRRHRDERHQLHRHSVAVESATCS